MSCFNKDNEEADNAFHNFTVHQEELEINN